MTSWASKEKMLSWKASQLLFMQMQTQHHSVCCACHHDHRASQHRMSMSRQSMLQHACCSFPTTASAVHLGRGICRPRCRCSQTSGSTDTAGTHCGVLRNKHAVCGGGGEGGTELMWLCVWAWASAGLLPRNSFWWDMIKKPDSALGAWSGPAREAGPWVFWGGALRCFLASNFPKKKSQKRIIATLG